jgi:cytidyltransferase-like protein
MHLSRLVVFLAFHAYAYVAEAWSSANYISQQSSSRFSTTACFAQAATNTQGSKFKHTLAVLTIPSTSIDRIANEAILDTAVQHGAQKLSVVLRCEGKTPSLASLRRYVGEVYSTLWDCAMATGNPDSLDVVVYPQNLPNAAPEQWINHQPDLDSVCSHDSICGWVSESARGRGVKFMAKEGDGVGGLDDHVAALNADRAQRKLPKVTALHVDPWPSGASLELHQAQNVVFLDDDTLDEPISSTTPTKLEEEDDDDEICSLLGGARIPCKSLFNKVAVGGTFDGMHFGHRKLLTLAVSSVDSNSGSLMIGITVDAMLKSKKFAEYIPTLDERMEGVKEFIYRLAPGIKNRVRFLPISDEYGPPGNADGEDFDALVLSHETLDNGCELNNYRRDKLGFPPLALLCTRRTEPYGMSSTNLRRLRSEKINKAGVSVQTPAAVK